MRMPFVDTSRKVFRLSHLAGLLPILIVLAMLGFRGEQIASAQDAATEQTPSQFSHLTHAPLKMKCTKCHTGAETGESARFPAAESCVVCHTKFGAAQTTFPTKRAFHIPDFVIFSHQVHADAKAGCGTCHGNVEAAHQVVGEPVMRMKFCVDCHKETKASAECHICHDLGQ